MTDNESTLTSETPIADLLVQLAAQAQTLRALASLAVRQKGAFEDDDPTAMLAVLEKRQLIIGELNDPVRGLLQDGARIEAWLRAASGAERDQAIALLDEVELLLAEIIRMDGEGIATLESRLGALGRDIARDRSARSAHGAYRRASPSVGPASGDSNRFMDQRG